MTSLLFPRETLLHVVKTLPAAPQILARLGRMRLDPTADLNDVTALLKCDAALTARIIRIANTPAYSVGVPYASLEQALARVGFGEIYRIAGFAAIAQMTNQSLREYGIAGARLRENALLTALVMEAAAPCAGMDPNEAYSVGLLRSIGKIALEGFVRDSIDKEGFDPKSGRMLAEWERGLAGFTSCEAGAFVLNEWRFPADVSAAIAFHYFPESEAVESRLAHLLNLAAGATDELGFGFQGEEPYWTRSKEKWAGSGIDEGQLDVAAKAAMVQFTKLRAAIG
jgi:HD-like signal output (HDOD) protein